MSRLSKTFQRGGCLEFVLVLGGLIALWLAALYFIWPRLLSATLAVCALGVLAILAAVALVPIKWR